MDATTHSDTGSLAFVIVAVVFTLYQGARGFMFQWYLAKAPFESTVRKVLLLCIADAILYVIASAAGFVAVWIAFFLSVEVRGITELSGGAAALLIFLWVFGLLGISGQLPHLIQQGKLLPGKGP